MYTFLIGLSIYISEAILYVVSHWMLCEEKFDFDLNQGLKSQGMSIKYKYILRESKSCPSRALDHLSVLWSFNTKKCYPFFIFTLMDFHVLSLCSTQLCNIAKMCIKINKHEQPIWNGSISCFHSHRNDESCRPGAWEHVQSIKLLMSCICIQLQAMSISHPA